jgi:hypothetical protein
MCYEEKGLYLLALEASEIARTAFRGQESIGDAQLYARLGRVAEAHRVYSAGGQPNRGDQKGDRRGQGGMTVRVKVVSTWGPVPVPLVTETR